MKRREFVSLLGTAAAWPLAARAQQGERVRRIGILITADENDRFVSAFTQALAELGWTDGRNVQMEVRWTGSDINRIRALAGELVGLQPDIIVASTTPATVALQRETPTIPIVFAVVTDPVAQRIVARLDRPSGNITGFADFEPTLGGKWVELLSEIAPGLKRAAIMFNPDTAPVSAYMPSFETAARSLKVEPIITPVHDDGEIKTAIIALGLEPGGGRKFNGAADSLAMALNKPEENWMREEQEDADKYQVPMLSPLMALWAVDENVFSTFGDEEVG